MRKLWRKLKAWFRTTFRRDTPEPIPDVPDTGPVVVTTPTQPAGDIKTDGTAWLRNGFPWRVLAKGLDFAAQPDNRNDYKRLVETDAALGVNLYFAYAGPGIGKPKHALPNEGGNAYDAVSILSRNLDYWHAVSARVDYANKHGISCVIANTFVDQGVLHDYTDAQLITDWGRTVAWFKGLSVMWCPLSEYDEQGSGGVTLGRKLAAQTPHPRTLHPARSSRNDADVQTFITLQNWDEPEIKRCLALGKPCIVAEDRRETPESEIFKRHARAEQLGAVYVLAHRNYGTLTDPRYRPFTYSAAMVKWMQRGWK